MPAGRKAGGGRNASGDRGQAVDSIRLEPSCLPSISWHGTVRPLCAILGMAQA